MAVELLVWSAIMVGLALAIVVYVGRSRGWYHYTPQTSLPDVGWDPQLQEETDGGSLLSHPLVWIVAFVLVVTAGIAGVFLFATGSGPASATTIILGGLAALVVVYLIGGTYLMARQRGHSPALAVMESATASGAVFLLLIAVQLVALG